MSTKDKIIYERNKKCTLPPPARSPFEEIPNLEAILAMEEAADLKKRNISKKVENEETLADYMMTAKQYQNLYDPKDCKDADLMLLKLR